MLEDHLVELAPASLTRVEIRNGARPFGARAMTQERSQDITAATREMSEPLLGSPERPIRTMAELQAWVDATAPAQAAAERRREELIQEFFRKPSEVLGF